MTAQVKGTRFSDGRRFNNTETEGVFRPSLGFDLYLTPHLLLNVDAAYVGPGDDLEDFAYGTVGGGLELRF